MRHGSNLSPPNRFESVHAEVDYEHVTWDVEYLAQASKHQISYQDDDSLTIVAKNDSPDIPFRYSINPYRGCVHACPYCYARNTHEYLGLNAGIDFETKIYVKRRAPELLSQFLAKKSWQAEPIVFSGVTDCYQPAEREFRLTRQCLEVAFACRQPIGMITKNALVLRDLEILREMAARHLIHVSLSITTLDPELARTMEPRTSIPTARLRAVDTLTAAGIPVSVMVAPIIPGLNDHEAPQILKAAKDAGATSASYVWLRLPFTVKPVFLEWLHRTQPVKAEKIESRLRASRGGVLNSTEFGRRMSGSGELADQFRAMFQMVRKRLGMESLPELDSSQFEPPCTNGQMRLF